MKWGFVRLLICLGGLGLKSLPLFNEVLMGEWHRKFEVEEDLLQRSGLGLKSPPLSLNMLMYFVLSTRLKKW